MHTRSIFAAFQKYRVALCLVLCLLLSASLFGCGPKAPDTGAESDPLPAGDTADDPIVDAGNDLPPTDDDTGHSDCPYGPFEQALLLQVAAYAAEMDEFDLQEGSTGLVFSKDDGNDRDWFVTGFTHVLDAPFYESVDCLYQLTYQVCYAEKTETGETVRDWFMPNYQYVSFRHSGYEELKTETAEDAASYTLQGMRYSYGEPPFSEDPQKVLLELAYDVSDLDFCLFQETYGMPYGPGSGDDFFGIPVNEERTKAPYPDELQGPIYSDGSYWYEVTYPGLSATGYHSTYPVDEDRLYSIDTTRTDFYTNRGIRVGSTRQDVLDAYPEIMDGDVYPNFDTWDENGELVHGDYLWYCAYPEPLINLGNNLVFWFEEDTVVRMQVLNLFD